MGGRSITVSGKLELMHAGDRLELRISVAGSPININMP